MDCLRRRRHHSNVVVIVVSCLLMADMSSATFTRRCSPQDVIYNPALTYRGRCGAVLSSAIEWICQGLGYNGVADASAAVQSQWKRSTIAAYRSPDSTSAAGDAFLARLMHGPRGSAEEGSEVERSSQFLDGSNALAFLQYKRQSDDDGLVQGIICECCVNPCSNAELSTYCNVSSSPVKIINQA